MRRQLAQSKPSGTTAVALFNPTENKPYTIDLILCCNISGAPVSVSIYHDRDGTTYDNTTALLWQHSLASDETFSFDNEISDYLGSGNVAVKTSVANSVVFSAYGEITGEKLT